MRTTIDIDDPILKEVRRLQRRTGHSLGRLVSDLLARSLADVEREAQASPPFCWTSAAMGAKVDLRDKEALRDAMDKPRR